MNKVYVITGAASGIGLSLTKKLAGDNIIFAGYRSESKRDFLSELSQNVHPFYVDYSKPETIKPAAEYIKAQCEKIDTLVNIAGCVVAGPAEKLNMDEVRRQFNVNVFGHLELTQSLADKMLNGKVINVSSMASFGIFPFISPYCASKRALDMFFNSFLIENKKNIKVVSIKPGVICTPLWHKSIEENIKYLDGCIDYKEEMECVINNARKNETCGLSADKVVKVILKADSANNPKLSYMVGSDALMAALISKLPQRLVNNIIKFTLKTRLKRNRRVL